MVLITLITTYITQQQPVDYNKVQELLIVNNNIHDINNINVS